MISKYLDPKNDFAFKKVFGQEKHKRIPISFLNAALCLEGDERIIDLEFLNPVQPPEVAARKESVVDVLVKDDKGQRYIIEMQVAKVKGFEKRAQYYAAKTYCANFNKTDKYRDLKKVIFLAITDYEMFPNKDGYKSDHCILDNETFENDLKDFSFTFVELPKFTKGLDDLKTLEDKWYYFLKHADESKDISQILSDNPEILEAYNVVERSHWNEEEIEAYDRYILAIGDYEGGLMAAKEDGIKEGIKQGIEQGIQKGEHKKAIEMAKNLLSLGLLQDKIASVTGLTETEIGQICIGLEKS